MCLRDVIDALSGSAVEERSFERRAFIRFAYAICALRGIRVQISACPCDYPSEDNTAVLSPSKIQGGRKKKMQLT